MDDYEIFATGARLMPIQIGKRWIWYVTDFIDDSFQNGKIINPMMEATTKEALIAPDEEENNE